MAKHGFERPWGHRETDGCHGTSELPLELSCEVVKSTLEGYEETLASWRVLMDKCLKCEVTEVPTWIRGYMGETRFVVVTPQNFRDKDIRRAFHKDSWEAVVDAYRIRLEWDSELLEGEMGRLRECVRTWVPRDLLPLGA